MAPGASGERLGQPVPRRATVGVALHSGWAIAVTLATTDDGFVVVDRRRLELSPLELPGQPYHHEARELDLADAEALVREVRQAVTERALAELQALRRDLADGIALEAIACREARPLPGTLAEILRSRALYIADAEIYRDAVCDAASVLTLTVYSYPKDGEFEFAARTLHTESGEITQQVRSWRTRLGPPWQKDHHAAAAAAMGALARLTMES